MPVAARIAKQRRQRAAARPVVLPVAERVARRHERAIAAAFVRALDRARGRATPAELRRAVLAGGGPAQVEALYDWPGFVDELLSGMHEALWATVVDAERATLPQVRRLVGRAVAAKQQPARRQSPPRLTAQLNLANPWAVEWAARHAALLVTRIDVNTRGGIRAVVERAQRKGLSVAEQAELIASVLGPMGLTARDAVAVDRFAEHLQLTTDIRAPQRYDMVVALAERLVARRAHVIARHESIAAANAGADAIWKEARAQGLLPETFVRVWLTAQDERTCPICQPMHGMRAALGAWFVSPHDGSTVEMPPIHVQCRCTTGMAEVDADEAAALAVASAAAAGPDVAGAVAAAGTDWDSPRPLDELLQRAGSASDRVTKFENMRARAADIAAALGPADLEQALQELAGFERFAFDDATVVLWDGPGEFTRVTWREVPAERRAEVLADLITSRWARGSDGVGLSMLAQVVADEHWGLGAATEHFPRYLLRSARQAMAERPALVAAIRAYLDGSYRATQQMLTGVPGEYVTLVRAIRLGDQLGGGGVTDVDLQPLSSFSGSPHVVGQFGPDVFFVQVPKGAVVGSARTSLGCLSESEYVLAGGRGVRAFHLNAVTWDIIEHAALMWTGEGAVVGVGAAPLQTEVAGIPMGDVIEWTRAMLVNGVRGPDLMVAFARWASQRSR